ncbi:MAG: penicillin-binding protein 2 [Bacilli bacterium]|nr:penicillin-binding protein 2 [Bacilli bacterium]
MNKNNYNSNKRLIVFSILIMVFFIVISLKLVSVQILNKDKYIESLESLTVDEVYSTSTPRGRIYDRNYNLLVDNVGVKTIYYKRKSGTTTKEQIKLAYKLSENIDIDYSKLDKINLKEFYLANNKELCNNKITKKEKEDLKQRKITIKEINNLKLERITDDELNKYTELDKKAAYIYYLMNKGYYYDEKIIKTYASDLEYAYVAEHISELNGFNVKLEWERKYLYGDTFRSILGNISTSESGIPFELKDKYLSEGYSLNDRVGVTYLEYQYESLLKGDKVKYLLNDDNSYTILDEGSRGHDIVLTIDINMQKQIEEILEEEIINAKKNNLYTTYYNGSHVIITQPNTGEILAMASKQIISKNGEYKIYDNTPALLTNPVTPGSIVKGASMTVGYKTGAINIGTTMLDECVKIQNTPAKCSWTKGLGYLNDIRALSYSSNAYQYKIAMKVANANYYYNGPLIIDESAFDTYRNTFLEYGLGEKTNIDLPVESYGYKGTSKNPGHLLDFAIGQYDTYTPIQIASYINTLASNGNKYQLHLLKEVHQKTNNEEIGKITQKIEPKLLGTVNLEQKYKDRIKLGFESVMKSLGYGYMGNVKEPAGKTGTAESFYDSDGDGNIDVPTISKGFIGYAPSNNPKFSIVVLSPNVRYGSSTYTSPVNSKISSRVSNKVFEILQ